MYSFYLYGGTYGVPWYYLLLVLVFLFCMIAQIRVKTVYRRYAAVHTRRGITGAEAAQRILAAGGAGNVALTAIDGQLTDHYDPAARVIRLSNDVFSGDGIAAVGVAAHEAGHALQYAEGYLPAKLRAGAVGLVRFASNFAMLLFVGGIVLGALGSYFYVVSYVGFYLFLTIAFFQAITLPVEFNASRRALRLLTESGVLDTDEVRGARAVLSAAALTYVGALAMTLLQVFRLWMILGGRGNRRR